MNTIHDLVKVICPEFPSDRKVRETSDGVSWYHIGGNPIELQVPPFRFLKSNIMELDRFSEAVRNFATMDIHTDLYDWDNLNLIEYSGLDCIDGLEKLKKITPGRLVAVDIETHNVKYSENMLLAIGFAVDDNTCYAFYDIPIKGSNCHGGMYAPSNIFRVYKLLQEIFADQTTTFLWHNGKFDINRLKYICNIDARVDEDTMLKHYACINEKKGTHGLKDLGFLYLNAPKWDDELDKIKREYCKKNKVLLADFSYDLIPIEILVPYMQRDCIATRRLLGRLDALAAPESDFVYKLLVDASNVYGKMELNGVQIDIEYLEDLEYDMEIKIRDKNKAIQLVAQKYWNPYKYVVDMNAKSMPKGDFNVKSPQQLKWMLYQLIGYIPSSTDADMMESLLELCERGIIENPDARVFIENIVALRKLNKYMDTYVQGIFSVLNPDGRLRCTYNLHGTETGRLSCSNPNMQNIPRDKTIKNIFKAAKGKRLVQLDYSQAELRVLAILSNDAFLIDTYTNGRDLHDAVAEDMFGPGFTKEQRVMAKTVNFGIAYGRGASSLSETFGMSKTEAQAFIDKWFKTVPGAKTYINTQRLKPIKGEPCITYFGRKRHFVITNDHLYHIQNEYVNTPIQSLASDLTMMSLIRIHQWIEQNNIDAKIVITVHDSIVLEVADDDEIVDKVAKECVKIMADVPRHYIQNCPVPFKADAEVGYSWGALKEWDTRI